MTDASIITAMAELEGWTYIHEVPFTDALHLHYVRQFGTNPATRLVEALPSYLTDANAVLRVLAWHSQMTYERDGGEPEVFRIYSPAGSHDKWGVAMVWMHHDGDIEHEVITAPTFCRAACEAILRAHGKWRES
jgi:hypothetical protein